MQQKRIQCQIIYTVASGIEGIDNVKTWGGWRVQEIICIPLVGGGN